MAKVSTARPPSRQSQEGAAAARTTRSTRSQSREPAKPASLEQRPGSRGKQQGREEAAPRKRGGRKPKNATDLTTVNEDAAIEDQLEAEIHATDQATVQMSDHARRISANSGMSGTTAKTSFSQEEIGELDPDVMVDVLPSLSSAADELVKLLVPADPKSRPIVRKEIRAAGSKHNKLYNNRLASLSIHKRSFGSQEYIQPSIVLRALLRVGNMRDVPQGPWRPDSVIFKINLAQMLNCVLILLSDHGDTTVEGYNAIENLDVHFATAIAGPEFDERALQLCMALLTQLLILRVAAYMNDPTFDLVDTTTKTFYSVDEDGDYAFRHRKVLHMTELPQDDMIELSRTLSLHVDELIRMTQDVTLVAALGTLRAKHPWETFVEQVIQYSLERRHELDEQIAAVGGIDDIMIGLAEEVQRREDARAAEVKRSSFSRPGGTPKKAFGKGGIRALKAREKQLAASTAPAGAKAVEHAPPPATAPVAQMTEPLFVGQDVPQQDDGWHRLEDDELPAQPTQAQSTARSTLAAMQGVQATQRQNAAKGKGRFIDRQNNATRVNFEDSQGLTQYQVPDNFQDAPTRGPYYQSPRRAPAKRSHEDDEPEDFDPTQDQGFEVDTRNITAADQRRQAAPQPRATAQPRFPSAPTNTAPGPSSGRTSADPSPAKRQRKNPGSSIPHQAPFDPDDDGDIPGSERYQRAKIAARHATVTARQTKPTQVRTPWTDEEERDLIDLIEEECADGIQYSKLKALDSSRAEPALGRRSAEDIRFKARNMKETMMKSRHALPRNFEYIVLDKKAIAKLHSLGIEYHQDRLRGGVEVDIQ